MDKRVKMREELYDFREEDAQIEKQLDEHDDEMDALQPKIEAIEEEIRMKQFELQQVERDYKDGSAYRREARQHEADEAERKRQLELALEEVKAGKDGQSERPSAKSNAFGKFNNNPEQLESFTNLDAEK